MTITKQLYDVVTYDKKSHLINAVPLAGASWEAASEECKKLRLVLIPSDAIGMLPAGRFKQGQRLTL